MIESVSDDWEFTIDQSNQKWKWDALFVGSTLQKADFVWRAATGFSVSAARISDDPEDWEIDLDIVDEESFQRLEHEQYVHEF